MATLTKAKVPGDVVKSEMDSVGSRENLVIGPSETLVLGEVVRLGAAGAMVKMGTLVNDVQTLKITGTLTAGFWTVGFLDKNGEEQITGQIAHDANLATINTEVDLALGADQVTVTGTAITAMVFTFDGADYDLRPQRLIHLDTGGVVGADDSDVVHTTVGGGGTGAAANEVQTETMTGTPSAGTFKLTMEDETGTEVTTTALNWDDALSVVQTAVDVAVGTDQIVLTGTTVTAMIFTFDGSLFEERGQPLVTMDISALTGATAATFAHTTVGGPGGEEKPHGIMLEAKTTSASEDTLKAVVLVRNAVVAEDQLTYGAGIKPDIIEEFRKLGISVREDV